MRGVKFKRIFTIADGIKGEFPSVFDQSNDLCWLPVYFPSYIQVLHRIDAISHVCMWSYRLFKHVLCYKALIIDQRAMVMAYHFIMARYGATITYRLLPCR